MKIYVCSKFEEWLKTQAAHALLKKAGHEISYDWTPHVQWVAKMNKKKGDTYKERKALDEKMAAFNALGVLRADALLVYDHERGRGLNVEMGIAIGNLTPVYVIPAPEVRNVFLAHPLVTVLSGRLPMDDLLRELFFREKHTRQTQWEPRWRDAFEAKAR